MSSETTTAPSTNASQSEFAAWIGIDPAALNEPDEPEEVVEATDLEEVPERPSDEPETPVEGERESAPDEPAVETPKLPFEAVANDEAVDPTLLASMQIKLKADGKEESISLADVVRRAQSEPAAQRKARAEESRANTLERQARDFENELAEVRRIALQMASDPDYYAQVVQDVESYNQPEERAKRAEEALATRNQQEQQARERAAREAQLTEFATTQIAPALDMIVGSNPLVTQEEILGKFFADTAKITVNGVIPPEYHASVAEYLRTDLADFVAQRQQTYADRDAKVKAETLKTQRERQQMKNARASATKPTGLSGALREESAPAPRGQTLKEAESGTLSALLNGLA